uniref:Uncharacterized protein n=1 Tax=Oryza barthii TaxID=65489 RepID=A0A0D3FSU5_9ORYZ
MRRRGSDATSPNSWRPPHMATISAMSESLRFTNATDRLNSGCNARVTWEMAPRETLAASRSGSPVRRGEGRARGRAEVAAWGWLRGGG